jgi:hypothetical protein
MNYLLDATLIVSSTFVGMLLLLELGRRDITTTRTMATKMHPPFVIFVLLFGLALTGALPAGHGMGSSKSRSWVHMVGFAAAMALALYVIVDIEYPRQGLIRVDSFDEVLVDVRETMK